MNTVEYTYQIIDIEGYGFGYEITGTDGSRIRQEFRPGVPGFVRMTAATAESEAQAEVARLTSGT